MDKYEYKIRADEIKELIAKGDYTQAAEIADTIDWRRVKSVMMLCTISDLYKINRRYEDARDMLLLAYERRPGGRTICYSLCELSIKTEEFVQAVEYYKEFVQAAPKDPGRYILQYKLYEAQEVSLEERIDVLEELKKRDYREKWAYELAYLYHRVGLGTRCVEECDELILWFGEGKYVIKAMELKMLHQPLTPQQQEKYDHRFDPDTEYRIPQEGEDQDYEEAGSASDGRGNMNYEPMQQGYDNMQEYGHEQGYVHQGYDNIQSYGDGQGYVHQGYDNMQGYGDGQGYVHQGYDNMQGYGDEQGYVHQGYDNMQGYEDGQGYGDTQEMQGYSDAAYYGDTQEYGDGRDYSDAKNYSDGGDYSDGQKYDLVRNNIRTYNGETGANVYGTAMPKEQNDVPEPEEIDIQVKTMDVGQYNTLNLQAELAAGLREVLGDEKKSEIEDPVTRSIMAPMLESDTESLDYPQIEEVDEEDLEAETHFKEVEGSEVFFGETGELAPIDDKQDSEDGLIDITAEIVMQEFRRESMEEAGKQAELLAEQPVAGKTELTAEDFGVTAEKAGTNPKSEEAAAQPEIPQIPESRIEKTAADIQPPKELANVLAQESDGQISLVMPEIQNVEKQITGQINIEDILAEWERMKRENAEKGKEELRRHVLEQTGDMFTEFEASVRDGLLEKLENEKEIIRNAGEQQFSHKDGNQDEFNDEVEELEEILEPDEIPEIQEETAEKHLIPESGKAETAVPDMVSESGVEETAVPDMISESGKAETAVPDMVSETGAEETAVPDMVSETGAEETAVPDMISEAGAEETAVPDMVSETGAEKTAVPDMISGVEKEEIAGLDRNHEMDGEETAEPEMTSRPEEEKITGMDKSGKEADIPKSEENAGRDGNLADPYEKEAGTDTEKAEHARPLETAIDVTRTVVEREKAKVRDLTREEKELFASFIQSRTAKQQLVNILDNISMAAYTGNVIITGEEGTDTMGLAKNIVREARQADSNFSGKVAKINGQSLNNKKIEDIVMQLANGALIIENASDMTEKTTQELYQALQQERHGIIVILEGRRHAMDRFLARNKQLENCFPNRMDVEALSNDMLVSYGRQYAREREYSIDELGILALHTRIDELQTLEHAVTVLEVKEIVDEAIRHASRKSLGHFFDVLFAKRYDEEDMIILGEKDFN